MRYNSLNGFAAPDQATVLAPSAPTPSQIVLMSVQASLLPQLLNAARQARVTDFGASGNLALTWTVGPEGKASDVSVLRDSVKSDTFKNYVVEALMRFQFPQVLVPVNVSYTFTF